MLSISTINPFPQFLPSIFPSSLSPSSMQHGSYLLVVLSFIFKSGLGIYKRKKESEQESKHARVHAKKNSIKKTRTRTRKRPRKKELGQENTHANKCVFACFLARVLFIVDAFVYECVFSWTSSLLRGRVRVCVDACLFSCFLTFFFSYINSQPKTSNYLWLWSRLHSLGQIHFFLVLIFCAFWVLFSLTFICE